MKQLDEKQQMNLVRLVCNNKLDEAFKLESELNKYFYVSEGVDRLNKALNAGEVCYENKFNTPFWIKNNIFLEQCFATGYKNAELKSSI